MIRKSLLTALAVALLAMIAACRSDGLSASPAEASAMSSASVDAGSQQVLDTWGVTAKPTKNGSKTSGNGKGKKHKHSEGADTRHATGTDKDGDKGSKGNGGGAGGPGTSPGMNPRAQPTPTSVSGVPGTITQVATSNSDTYALTSAGMVYAVGDGSRGELGNGTTPKTTSSAVKVDFPVGVRIAKLANPSGLDGGLAIDTTGHAWAWGVNGAGQDCQGTSSPILKPVKLPLSHVTLAAGALQHTIFDANGKLVTCGKGRYGQLGNGTSGATGQSGIPVAVKGLPKGKAVAVTDSWGDAGVLMADGQYYDWGYDKAGQVGDGSTTNRTTAYHVSLPAKVTEVSQGGSIAANGQTMTLLADGQLWEWGNGQFGQMGDAKLANETRPIRLIEPRGAHFVTINSGGATNYAIDSHGTLWAWGRDNSGQIGDGTYLASVNRPVSDHVRASQVASTASEVAALAAKPPTAATLTVGAANAGIESTGQISPLTLGANGHWFDQDFGGWNPATQSAYPAFVTALQQSGVSSVRYPSGTAANLFEWKRAIGPVTQRTPQIGLSDHGFTAPEDDDFGPDEYGTLSEQLHQPGDILVNFNSTPTNAAEEVDYLTGTVGAEKIDGVDWAALRAKNGHPAPYDIPYWEVGNEMDSGHQLYWRAGKSSKNIVQLYTDGGSTTFTKQLAGTFDDYRNSAAVSSATASEHFQAKYPPVTSGSAHVYVGSQEWTEVQSLPDVSASAHDYTLNDDSGQITFGDGTHGAIPAKGSKIAISYTSGPHAGFNAFYAAMKKANPSIKICAGLSDEQATDQFIKMEGNTHPYDCVQHHAYINPKKTPIPRDESATDYYERVLADEPGQVGEVSDIEHAIDQYAAARARDIGVAVTEYGQNGGAPKGDPSFHESLSQAILMGDDLTAWAQLGVPEADKANLNGFLTGAQPAGEPVPVKGDNGDSEILRASPTQFILSATGLVSPLFTPLTDGTVQGTTVTGNPQIATPSGQRLPSLTTVASRQPDGDLELFVVNQSPSQAVSTELRPGMTHGATAQLDTLDGSSITAINTATSQQVTTKTSTASVGSGLFRYAFPAHSITRIELTGRSPS